VAHPANLEKFLSSAPFFPQSLVFSKRSHFLSSTPALSHTPHTPPHTTNAHPLRIKPVGLAYPSSRSSRRRSKIFYHTPPASKMTPVSLGGHLHGANIRLDVSYPPDFVDMSRSDPPSPPPGPPPSPSGTLQVLDSAV